ncbi:MAG: V-type ATP synthase subunit F [Sphaerochaetaceae bacterium]|nr:V-type ATP synthase subunit F [Sphaerochaetaceae bacterium]
MEYYVIGDEDTVLGFSLVGVQGTAVADEREARTAWAKTLEKREIGIIIITESAADMIRSTVDRYLFSESFPLVVEIPDPGKKSTRDLRSLVNEAIGVSL